LNLASEDKEKGHTVAACGKCGEKFCSQEGERSGRMQKLRGPNKEGKTVGANNQNKRQRKCLYIFGREI